MTKGRENGPEDCGPGSEGEERQAPLPQIQDQSNKGSVKGWAINTIIKEGKLPISFYMYILLLFAGCFILLPQFDGIRVSISSFIFSFMHCFYIKSLASLQSF